MRRDPAHAVPSVIPEPAIVQTGRRWTLANDVAVHDPARGAKWIIRAGTTTDLASIPQLAQAAITKEHVGVKGALSHDDLYTRGGVVPPDGRRLGHTYSRAEADRLLLEFMQQHNKSTPPEHAASKVRRALRWMDYRRRLALHAARCRAVYAAVRLFGGRAWQQPSAEATAINATLHDREAA